MSEEAYQEVKRAIKKLLDTFQNDEPEYTYNAVYLAQILTNHGIEFDIKLYTPSLILKGIEEGAFAKNVKPVWVQVTRYLGCQVVSSGFGNIVADAIVYAVFDNYDKNEATVKPALKEAIKEIRS